MLTYGQTDYLSFQDLLTKAGGTDGQVYYDLGAGVGTSLIGAAFSDIQFLRCVGIELLPGLVEVGRRLLDKAKDSAPELEGEADRYYKLHLSGNQYQFEQHEREGE